MIGIYKIESPSGKIYIGQSINIKKRLSVYKGLRCKDQPYLYNSLKKYGFENHTVEILEQCKKEELNDKEIFYIKKYNSFESDVGLNLKAGGHRGGTLSEVSKKKLRKPKSKETKDKIRKKALGRKASLETKEKHRINMLGNKNLLGYKTFLGRNHTEETKNKIREKRKLQVMPKGYKRPEFSKEWKENMSKSNNSERGLDNSRSRLVLNLDTGIFYSISEVSFLFDKRLNSNDLQYNKGKYSSFKLLK